MRFDFFDRPEGKNFDPDAERYLLLDLPFSLEDFSAQPWIDILRVALTTAWKSGLSKGSFRSGCYQVQCDAGIFSHKNAKRIDLDKLHMVTFKTWEQLDAEFEAELNTTPEAS